uniref:Uncharacterized protein n=1 Tax=Panagrolaimus sp. PS1159 TaxID=55785 RepID=A0AC35F9H8_9BILA
MTSTTSGPSTTSESTTTTVSSTTPTSTTTPNPTTSKPRTTPKPIEQPDVPPPANEKTTTKKTENPDDKIKILTVEYKERAKSNIPYYLLGGGFLTFLICIIFICLIIKKVICFDNVNENNNEEFNAAVASKEKPTTITNEGKSAEPSSLKNKEKKS